jgi:pSer/pThr/pTyr-binding forkhead associated (FHA) protein
MSDGAVRTHPLTGRRISLGRTSDNDLAFPDEAILSRRHMSIDYDGTNWWVEDLGSKNGTASTASRSRAAASCGEIAWVSGG